MRFLLLVLSGIGMTVLLLWLSWAMYDRYISNPAAARPKVVISFQEDAYTQAIRIAQAAALAGKTADTSGEWFAVAGQWQQAAELMTVVPSVDRRHASAQTRLKFYRENSTYARRQAEARK
jgi:hypothetical protein